MTTVKVDSIPLDAELVGVHGDGTEEWYHEGCLYFRAVDGDLETIRKLIADNA